MESPVVGTTFTLILLLLLLIGLPICAYFGARLSTYGAILAGMIILLLEDYEQRRAKQESQEFVELSLIDRVILPITASCEASATDDLSGSLQPQPATAAVISRTSNSTKMEDQQQGFDQAVPQGHMSTPNAALNGEHHFAHHRPPIPNRGDEQDTLGRKERSRNSGPAGIAQVRQTLALPDLQLNHVTVFTDRAELCRSITPVFKAGEIVEMLFENISSALDKDSIRRGKLTGAPENPIQIDEAEFSGHRKYNYDRLLDEDAPDEENDGHPRQNYRFFGLCQGVDVRVELRGAATILDVMLNTRPLAELEETWSQSVADLQTELRHCQRQTASLTGKLQRLEKQRAVLDTFADGLTKQNEADGEAAIAAALPPLSPGPQPYSDKHHGKKTVEPEPSPRMPERSASEFGSRNINPFDPMHMDTLQRFLNVYEDQAERLDTNLLSTKEELERMRERTEQIEKELADLEKRQEEHAMSQLKHFSAPSVNTWKWFLTILHAVFTAGGEDGSSSRGIVATRDIIDAWLTKGDQNCTAELSVLIEPREDGPVEMLITYVVTRCLWKPAYDIRLFNSDGSMKRSSLLKLGYAKETGHYVRPKQNQADFWHLLVRNFTSIRPLHPIRSSPDALLGGKSGVNEVKRREVNLEVAYTMAVQ
ncbi:unnamed protein product [Schistocephalus solidus]|uniref:DUF4140 domain-containing protein n=1 Tax=Schistocephalus solidus TaxID=70667 RepID=A0A183T7Q0_SCHSO|nr:unnamed protein product [Schistocephalus solidus]